MAGSSLRFGASGKITHVVVIVQENRSFDNLFHGFPGANTVSYGNGHGKKYTLKPLAFEEPYDIDHAHTQFLVDYDRGKNDGFDRELDGFKPGCAYALNHPPCWLYYTAPQRMQMAFSYVPQSETVPYWAMAKQYALGDNTFASNNGPSYPSHQYLIAGQSEHISENPEKGPWGCDSPSGDYTFKLLYGSATPPYFSPPVGHELQGPLPCFQYRSAADLLDGAHVSWAYYAPEVLEPGGIWSAFDAIWGVRFGLDWVRNVKAPETTIFNDISAKTLPQVSWVAPAFINSDHAGSDSATGPQWVAAVVNAIGNSSYWQNTAIVIVWDEWGGWYDHVLPPQLKDPSTGAYEGLGYRVPLIVVSPYAKPGYISHGQHEIASTLHFIEATFGLPSLGLADKRADDLSDMLDLSQPPTPFKTIAGARPLQYFIHQQHASTPPDD